MPFASLRLGSQAPGTTQVGPGMWLHRHGGSWRITRCHICTQTDMRITTHRLATQYDHAVAALMRWWELVSFALGADTIELTDASAERWTLARYRATSGHWHIIAVCNGNTPKTFALKPEGRNPIEALRDQGLDTKRIEHALAELEHWLSGEAVNDSPPLYPRPMGSGAA